MNIAPFSTMCKPWELYLALLQNEMNGIFFHRLLLHLIYICCQFKVVVESYD